MVISLPVGKFFEKNCLILKGGMSARSWNSRFSKIKRSLGRSSRSSA